MTTPDRCTRALRTLSLLCAVACLPAVVAAQQARSAQDLAGQVRSGALDEEAARQAFDRLPPTSATAQRLEKGAAKVDELVASGRLTAEQGAAKKAEMRESLIAMAFETEVMGRSPEEAKRVVDERAAAARAAGSYEWMRAPLRKAGVADENLEAVLGGIRAVVEERDAAAPERGGASRAGRGAGEEGGREPGSVAAQRLSKLGLTPAQLKIAMGLAQKGPQRPAAGPDPEVVRGKLRAAGIPEARLELATEAVGTMAARMRAQGKAYKMDPELAKRLQAAGLTAPQFKAINGLAKEASRAGSERGQAGQRGQDAGSERGAAGAERGGRGQGGDAGAGRGGRNQGGDAGAGRGGRNQGGDADADRGGRGGEGGAGRASGGQQGGGRSGGGRSGGSSGGDGRGGR